MSSAVMKSQMPVYGVSTREQFRSCEAMGREDGLQWAVEAMGIKDKGSQTL